MSTSAANRSYPLVVRRRGSRRHGDAADDLAARLPPPTFAIEILPIVDVLPTWTGCVGLVVAHRRRQMRTQ
jgi:hypothetical protein